MECSSILVQSWFADDSSCAGPLENIISWIEKLSIEGPKSGYYLQLKKCYCIVHPDFEVQANNTFSKLNVNVVTGFKFIGGFIGSNCDTEKWLIEKVQKWVMCVLNIASVAKNIRIPHIRFLQNPFSTSGVIFYELSQEQNIISIP